MNNQEIKTMLAFVRGLDIGTNPEPAALFDPLIQGFNIWCIPSDHPGGDWDNIIKHFDAGAYSKRCEYVGCAFYDSETGSMTLTTDAYALRDHMPQKYHYGWTTKGRLGELESTHNRPDDIRWARAKVEWVFSELGIPCPEIVIGEDD